MQRRRFVVSQTVVVSGNCRRKLSAAAAAACRQTLCMRSKTHREPGGGCTGQDPPGRDVSDDGRSRAVCGGVSHLPRAD